MLDIARFARAFLRHWAAPVIGGALVAVIAIVEHVTGRAVPGWLYLLIGCGAVVVGAYRTWRVEFKRAGALSSAEVKRSADQQQKAADGTVRLVLYERRLKVYQALMTFLAAGLRAADIKNSDLDALLQGTVEADFVFSANIKDCIREAYEKGVDLHAGVLQLAGSQLPVGSPERERIVEKNREILDWFSREITIAIEKYHPFLDLTTP